jgi:hypothetical protein
MRFPTFTILTALLAIAACRGSAHQSPSPRTSLGALDVSLRYDEADAALAIVAERVAGQSPSNDDWQRPFSSQGYRHLSEREASYGEGQAMLAAAGGPDIHPHEADPDSVKRRWDSDVARAAANIALQTDFFDRVLDGKIASADSVRGLAATYYGVQGPWYTVGWLMASTIERELGRPSLIATLCDPPEFLARYNDAARRANARGQALPLWNPSLIVRLKELAG